MTFPLIRKHRFERVMTADSRSRRQNLLIAGTIGVVAAMATLILIHVAPTSATTSATDNACIYEYKHLQAALLAYMANNNLDTLPASSGTADMTAPVPLFHGVGTLTDPNYVRDPQTRWTYVWDSTGTITAIQRGPGGAVPPGCIVSSG